MSPQHTRLAVDVFTACVVASVGVALAGLTWRLTGESGVMPVAAPVAATGGSGDDLRDVLALSPFGAATAVSADPAGGAVKLRAIFMSVPAETSVALIAGADGKVASYAIGQSVGDGVIEAITPEQVVLRTAGGQRVLGFNPPGSPGAPPAAVPPPAAIAPAPAAAAPSGVEAVRALIPKAAQGLPQAPAAGLSNGTGAPPESGLRIGGTANPALAAAGIRSGDVIMRVNGNPVGPGTNESDLMNQAIAAGSARIELLRDGQRVSLTVPVR